MPEGHCRADRPCLAFKAAAQELGPRFHQDWHSGVWELPHRLVSAVSCARRNCSTRCFSRERNVRIRIAASRAAEVGDDAIIFLSICQAKDGQTRKNTSPPEVHFGSFAEERNVVRGLVAAQLAGRFQSCSEHSALPVLRQLGLRVQHMMCARRKCGTPCSINRS